MNEKLSSNSAPLDKNHPRIHTTENQITWRVQERFSIKLKKLINTTVQISLWCLDVNLWVIFFNQKKKKKKKKERRQNCNHMISALKKLHKHTLKCSVNGYLLSPCTITWLIFVSFSVKCLLPLDCTPLRARTVSSRLLLVPSTRAKAHTYVWLNR